MVKLSCSTLSFDKFDDNNFEQTFRYQPRTPFRYVEFNCWYPSDLMPDTIAYLREMCRTTGLLPSAIYGMGFGSDNNRELTMDVCHKLRMVDAAREIGCARIVATGAKRGTKGGIDAIIAALRDVVPYAEQRGVLVSLENHANNNLETIEDYDRVFRAVDSPNLGLCVDTGHFDASGIDLDAVIDHFGPKINHVHVKEAAAVGETRFVPFGEGVTDNNHVIERMIEIGYRGFVSLEYVALDMTQPLEHMKVPWEMFGKYAAA